MTSKGCSVAIRSTAIAVFGICLGCFSSKQDAREHAVFSEAKTEEGEEEEEEDGVGVAVVAEDGAAFFGIESYDPPEEPGLDLPEEPCPLGQMRLDDLCQPKAEADKILERRETKALEKVREAHGPSEAATASQELLEQQVIQMGRTEANLDEIIEQLQRKQAEKDARIKMAGGPEGLDRRPP
jgi:hypothetical protein